MTNLKKALIGTAAATAMAVSATPALAKHGHHKKNKVNAGDVIAGALIVGGIAAVLSSKNKKRSRHYDRGHRGYGYNDGYNSNRYNKRERRARKAINRCVRAVEGASHYGRKNVTDIGKVKRTDYGWKVKGRVTATNGYRGHRGGYGNSSYDSGKFTCYIENGRVVDLNYKGLRGY